MNFAEIKRIATNPLINKYNSTDGYCFYIISHSDDSSESNIYSDNSIPIYAGVTFSDNYSLSWSNIDKGKWDSVFDTVKSVYVFRSETLNTLEEAEFYRDIFSSYHNTTTHSCTYNDTFNNRIHSVFVCCTAYKAIKDALLNSPNIGIAINTFKTLFPEFALLDNPRAVEQINELLETFDSKYIVFQNSLGDYVLRRRRNDVIDANENYSLRKHIYKGLNSIKAYIPFAIPGETYWIYRNYYIDNLGTERTFYVGYFNREEQLYSHPNDKDWINFVSNLEYKVYTDILTTTPKENEAFSICNGFSAYYMIIKGDTILNTMDNTSLVSDMMKFLFIEQQLDAGKDIGFVLSIYNSFFNTFNDKYTSLVDNMTDFEKYLNDNGSKYELFADKCTYNILNYSYKERVVSNE